MWPLVHASKVVFVHVPVFYRYFLLQSRDMDVKLGERPYSV